MRLVYSYEISWNLLYDQQGGFQYDIIEHNWDVILLKITNNKLTRFCEIVQLLFETFFTSYYELFYFIIEVLWETYIAQRRRHKM